MKQCCKLPIFPIPIRQYSREMAILYIATARRNTAVCIVITVCSLIIADNIFCGNRIFLRMFTRKSRYVKLGQDTNKWSKDLKSEISESLQGQSNNLQTGHPVSVMIVPSPSPAPGCSVQSPAAVSNRRPGETVWLGPQQQCSIIQCTLYRVTSAMCSYTDQLLCHCTLVYRGRTLDIEQ